MIIEYKKQSELTKYFEKNIKCNKFKKGTFFEKLGIKSVTYPDIYFHTGALNKHAKLMIENSKIVIVNSSILKDELLKDLTVQENTINVIYPTVDVPEYKKKTLQKNFLHKHNIHKDNKIIYFTAENFMRSGFENFCDIINKIESNNFSVFITCNNDKELVYVKTIVKKYSLEYSANIIKEEIFNVSDIFVLPTINKNFSLNIIKAMANKCVVFIPQSNYSVEILDVFSIMDDENDSNTAYKIDMLLRVPDELKKIKKENYNLAKKLNKSYAQNKLKKIIKQLKTN